METVETWIVDLSLNGRSKVDSYRSFLSFISNQGLKARTHRDVWRDGLKDAPELCVRHDVDHDIDMALSMARLENDLGIKSSYYLLPPGDYGKSDNYYGRIESGKVVRSQKMISIAKEIQEMGHEIGLHNDFLQLSHILRRDLYDVFASELDFFDKNNIAVSGSASHGSRFAREHGYINYEIFAEVQEGKSVQRKTINIAEDEVVLPCISMEKLGLEYEAYSINRQSRISDVGGKILVYSNKKLEEASFINNQFLDCRCDLKGRAVMLIHPEHWVEFDRLTHLPTELAKNG